MDSFLTQIPIPNFPSLYLTEIDLDSPYFPLSPLADILGYSTPYSLIQNIPPELKISVSELYSLYTLYLDQFYSYTPMDESVFKKSLVKYKPLWFTNKEGIVYILSKNTFTIPRLKESIAEVLGLSTIAPPRKESIFYDALYSMLKDTGIRINRHLYLAGYFVDIELDPIHVVVEYDENNHKYYDKEKEDKRENVLKALGYSIIRTDDSVPPIESATAVFKQILPMIQ